MKKLLFFLLVVCPAVLFAASPSFRDFTTNDFTTTGNTIRARRASQTNDGFTTSDLVSWQYNIPPGIGGIVDRVPPAELYQSWPVRGGDVTEANITAAIDHIATNGWTSLVDKPYVTLDDGWGYHYTTWSTNAPRTAGGVIRVDTNRFPNCVDGVGLRYLADYAHARNIRFKVYVEGKSVSGRSVGGMVTVTNVQLDALTIVDWRIDGVKYQSREVERTDEDARLFYSYLHTNGPVGWEFLCDSPLRRDDLFTQWPFTIGMGSLYVPDGGGDPEGTFTNAMSLMDGITNKLRWISPSRFLGLAWMTFTADSATVTNEAQSIMASRAMIPVPIQLANQFADSLFVGDYVRMYQRTWQNKRAWEINQDQAVIPMERVLGTTNSESQQVWVRPLGAANSKRKAVWLLNRGNIATNMTVPVWTLGYGVTNANTPNNNFQTGTNIITLRDVFNDDAVTFVTNQWTDNIGIRASKLYIVTPGYDPDILPLISRRTAQNTPMRITIATNVVINPGSTFGANNLASLEVQDYGSTASDFALYLGNSNGAGYGLKRNSSSGFFEAVGFQGLAFSGLVLKGNTSTEMARFSGGGWQGRTNAIADWPTSAATAGGFAIVNSNATVYILTSSPNSTTWAATNKIAP